MINDNKKIINTLLTETNYQIVIFLLGKLGINLNYINWIKFNYKNNFVFYIHNNEIKKQWKNLMFIKTYELSDYELSDYQIKDYD